MTAEFVENAADPRTRPISRTISAIGEALSGARRLAFYAEVLAAGQGDEINAVMGKWWLDAMLDQCPGRERRLDDVNAGVGLVELPALIDENR